MKRMRPLWRHPLGVVSNNLNPEFRGGNIKSSTTDRQERLLKSTTYFLLLLSTTTYYFQLMEIRQNKQNCNERAYTTKFKGSGAFADKNTCIVFYNA